MSTFDGVVKEFPEIRIDYFRHSPSDGGTRPLAFFVSHAHSDHLVGLETFKSAFIYCSAATREIILRLEKYPHRMNFSQGILEVRKQSFRHLKPLLKAIPLETPTVIELNPTTKIRVTLFDANHCVGGVMFLIEGDGKAILYTGDIRSEPWWVDALTRHPILLSFACVDGKPPIKRLDCIYLDTTFVVRGLDAKFAHFPSKAEGLRELLEQVKQYPADTLFYFDSWTFGYEEVWQALSTFLNTPIHVDEYRYGLYLALANGPDPKAPEAAKLIGFYCGNHFQSGCLIGRSEICRLHSCEAKTGCDIWDKDFVRITPIISRHNGFQLEELGAGGGHGDLKQKHELEVTDTGAIHKLIELCTSQLRDDDKSLTETLKVLNALKDKGVRFFNLDDFETAFSGTEETGQDLSIAKLVPFLARTVENEMRRSNGTHSNRLETSDSQFERDSGLPKQVVFPYSRHSSYDELCYLISRFQPNDIIPCTVDDANWTPASSMSSLFGHIYSAPFSHDHMMLEKKMKDPSRADTARSKLETLQDLICKQFEVSTVPSTNIEKLEWRRQASDIVGALNDGDNVVAPPTSQRARNNHINPRELLEGLTHHSRSETGKLLDGSTNKAFLTTQRSAPVVDRSAYRKEVYDAILDGEGFKWSCMGLSSVSGHQIQEQEL